MNMFYVFMTSQIEDGQIKVYWSGKNWSIFKCNAALYPSLDDAAGVFPNSAVQFGGIQIALTGN